MRQILTLFCATALVLSATAAPVLPLRSAKYATQTTGTDASATKAKPIEKAPAALTGETIEVAVANASTLDDATTLDGYFQIIGEDDNYYASICVNTKKLTGTFTNADIDYDYTGLYILSGEEEEEVIFGVIVKLQSEIVRKP